MIRCVKYLWVRMTITCLACLILAPSLAAQDDCLLPTAFLDYLTHEIYEISGSDLQQSALKLALARTRNEVVSYQANCLLPGPSPEPTSEPDSDRDRNSAAQSLAEPIERAIATQSFVTGIDSVSVFADASSPGSYGVYVEIRVESGASNVENAMLLRNLIAVALQLDEVSDFSVIMFDGAVATDFSFNVLIDEEWRVTQLSTVPSD